MQGAAHHVCFLFALACILGRRFAIIRLAQLNHELGGDAKEVRCVLCDNIILNKCDYSPHHPLTMKKKELQDNCYLRTMPLQEIQIYLDPMHPGKTITEMKGESVDAAKKGSLSNIII